MQNVTNNYQDGGLQIHQPSHPLFAVEKQDICTSTPNSLQSNDAVTNNELCSLQYRQQTSDVNYNCTCNNYNYNYNYN